jgi:hypothetical protein
VSLIGTLEQFNLSSVLQRVETHSKTGLLIVKQGAHWVEFYFREGRLLCIGPVRTNATLGERLLQDGVISAQALQQALLAIGSDQPGETQTALALMDMGLAEHSALRAWATQKALDVLRVLLIWTSGEIYFEDEVPPPPDRLLVALSVTALLASLSTTGSVSVPQSTSAGFFSSTSQQSERVLHTPPPDAAKLPTLMSASQFFQETPAPMVSLPGIEAFVSPSSTSASASPAPSPVMPASALLPTTDSLAPSLSDAPLLSETEALPPFLDLGLDEGSATNSTLSRPERVMNPVPPKRIDTSFMRPDMVLAPVDLSAFREQNPPIQLTPDQWRLLTRVDGRTSLQVACQELRVPPALVCRVAGELLAEGLIQLIPPGATPIQISELSPISSSMATSGLNNGYVTPGYAATTAPPWSPTLPTSDVASPHTAAMPFEAESQWGNGGNGATFVPGRGWVATSQPLQPLNSSGSLVAQSGPYAQVGGGR